MKRRSIIWGMLVIVGVVILLMLVYGYSYRKALSDQEARRVKETPNLEECYYIMADDGYVTVYLADKKTPYEYTTILVSELPDALQQELQEGKKVTTLGQVYGFLENYSS
ncbi:MAG: hypothetical protein UHS49_07065 [Faecalimonas sp.]|nr:hypothetical protein [Faecalimonas sp.]